jgi:hypothetical protein
MARYTLPQYQSVYRDPGSVQVNTMLRDRFANAVVADDALTASVDGMQSADYEGDNQLKAELAEEYNAKLDERARRGDYETAGMSITKDSRGFLKSYQPIQENFGRVQAYQAKIKAEYDNKDINSETYKNLMAMSNKDYTGLQKNDDGTINEDSYFSGYSTVRDVDIATEFDGIMDGYAAREGGSEVQLVGQGPGGAYMIKKGNEWEEVPQKDVDTLFNNLLRRPDVQASLRQKGDVGTYQLTDEQISTSIGNSLYGDPENEDSQGLIAKYDELVASGKEDKETVAMMDQLEDLIAEREGLLGEAGVESSEELINKRRNYAKNEVIGSEIGSERNAAYAKYIRNNVKTSYIEDWDKRYLIDYKQQVADYVPIIHEDTGMSELNAPSGTSVESVNKYIQIHDNNLASISNDATAFAVEQGYIETDETGKPARMLTIDDIKNGNVPEGMEGLVDKYRSQIYAAETQKVIAEKRLTLARESIRTSNASGETYLKKSLGKTKGGENVSGEDALNKARELTGNPDLTIEELFSAYKEGAEASNKAIAGLGTPGGYKQEDLDKILSQNPNYLLANQLDVWAKETGFGGVTAFQRGLLNSSKEDEDAINKYLSDNSRIQTGGMTRTTMPGVNAKESQQNTKAVKTHFEKKLLNPNFKIYYNGQVQSDGTGTAASLVKDLGWDESAVTVSQVTFDTVPYLGEPTLQFKVKGTKDEKVVFTTVKVPYSNLQQDGMDQYFNKPGYRMALEVNIARHSQLPNTTIGFFNKEGKQTSSIDWDFATGKSSGDVITLIDENGVKRSITADAASQMINDAGNTHTFRTIK